MAIDAGKYREIRAELGEKVKLVAVSKTKPVEDIQALYDLGQRDFGENYVQELVDKQAVLPADIRWHFIGHLQSNKVKFIAPFVHLIHGVDSARLLKEIDKQGARNNRRIACLLQVHIAREETKFGLDESELAALMQTLTTTPPSANPNGTTPDKSVPTQTEYSGYTHVIIEGLMGMASFTEDLEKVKTEFHSLKSLFDQHFPQSTSSATHQTSSFPSSSSGSGPSSSPDNTPSPILSMGMSADYRIAIAAGSNLVRIGSLLFGKRG